MQPVEGAFPGGYSSPHVEAAKKVQENLGLPATTNDAFARFTSVREVLGEMEMHLTHLEDENAMLKRRLIKVMQPVVGKWFCLPDWQLQRIAFENWVRLWHEERVSLINSKFEAQYDEKSAVLKEEIKTLEKEIATFEEESEVSSVELREINSRIEELTKEIDKSATQNQGLEERLSAAESCIRGMNNMTDGMMDAGRQHMASYAIKSRELANESAEMLRVKTEPSTRRRGSDANLKSLDREARQELGEIQAKLNLIFNHLGEGEAPARGGRDVSPGSGNTSPRPPVTSGTQVIRLPPRQMGPFGPRLVQPYGQLPPGPYGPMMPQGFGPPQRYPSPGPMARAQGLMTVPVPQGSQMRYTSPLPMR